MSEVNRIWRLRKRPTGAITDDVLRRNSGVYRRSKTCFFTVDFNNHGGNKESQ